MIYVWLINYWLWYFLRFVAKKEDQGRYSCLAENNAGSDQKFVDLFVAGKELLKILHLVLIKCCDCFRCG